MNHTDTLRRAWQITWRYRVLWIFGLFLAVMGGQAGSSGGGGSSGYSGDSSDLPWRALPQFSEREIGVFIALVGAFIVAAIAFALLVALISTVLRYLAETAVIRAVDDHEETGEKRSFGAVFRLGWSWRAIRLFLIEMVVSIPMGALFVALVLFALAPLLLWFFESDALGALGTVVTVGLFVAIILLGIGVSLVWSLLQPFIWRAAVLDDSGVFASIKRGYTVVKSRLRDAAIMWLLLAVIQFLLGLVVLVATFALAVLGLLMGGLMGIAVYALASLAFDASTPVILGVLAGLPVALVVIGVPTLFVSALAGVFRSTAWTLTYRELSPSVAAG